MDAIAVWFGETLGQYISAELVTFLVSLFPLLECRGGIIVGRLLGLPLVETVIISIIGNVLPIPFILLFIKKIFKCRAIGIRFFAAEKVGIYTDGKAPHCKECEKVSREALNVHDSYHIKSKIREVEHSKKQR